jgi:hypothetical protein
MNLARRLTCNLHVGPGEVRVKARIKLGHGAGLFARVTGLGPFPP